MFLNLRQTKHSPSHDDELDKHISVERNPRARRLALRLDAGSGKIRLIIPGRMSIERARLFARDHEEWIREKLSSLPAPVPFQDGVLLPLFGKEVRLDIYTDESLKMTKCKLVGNYLQIKTNKHDPAGRITRFIKQEAKTLFHEISRNKAAKIGKEVKSLSIRDTKSRWGSCSQDGNLSLSWRLAFAPFEAFDYVIAHEVAHLAHMDHSKSFWAVCEELSDNYKAGKSWMKQHGHGLMRYGRNSAEWHDI